MKERFNNALTRRRFLTYSGGALAAFTLPGLAGCQSETATPPAATAAALVFGETRVIPIGTQLYCVRELLDKEVPGTIAALAGMGYQAVEFADYHGLSAPEWRKLLDDNGLQACGTHIYIETMEGDELQKTIEFNLALGNRNLIVRSMNEDAYASKDALLRTCERYNRIAASLRPHGLRTGFHNHAEIFNRLDSEYAWNIFADNTDSDVILQMDTGNASHVDGVDVIELLKRNAGRTVTTHVKPFSKANPDAFLGADELDWSQIIPLYQGIAGTEFYIIEYEQDAFPPLEALEANLDILRGMLGRA